MKYSEIIDVERHFKSAFDITSDAGDSWKTFVSNEKFENNVNQIINCFISPVLNKRNSIWIQGTYGTGKSHSLAVIKHLLCDDYSAIEDYLPKINKSQLRSTISNFRQEKRVFPVVLKGIYAITDVADLTYTIQQQVSIALKNAGIEIATKTDFQSAIQIIQNGTLDSFFDELLKSNFELNSYAGNKAQLIQALERHETKVIRIIADEIKKTGLGGFRTHDIIEWLTEIKKELTDRGVADYLLIMWDEFTSLLDIPARRSILNVMQDIAELSKTEIEGCDDTTGVYLLLVTHKRLEQTESYKELKEDERNMAKARFVELDYDMQPTTTYHILSGALDRKMPEEWDALRQKNLMEVPSVKNVVDLVIDSATVNAGEVKKKILSLYPFHPYTSYLATFVSRVVGEAERSIFGFLNDEEYGFKKFLKNDVAQVKFLTPDYVWDFFYKTFESSSAGRFDAITNKYKLVVEGAENRGEEFVAVLKTILLLNILYRVTTTDADASEKNMVNPSTNNLISAFSGVMAESEVRKVLDEIDESQILHRNPDGIFEVSSSSLPQKKLMEEKKKMYSEKEDVSKILEAYSIKAVGKLRNTISRSIPRIVDVQLFWGGDKEHLLKGRISGKLKIPYAVSIALFVYRGETKELDTFLGRNEMSLLDSKGMLERISREDEFKNVIFVTANTALGNKRFEAYMDNIAQEAVARSLQMDDERREGASNAEKWIIQWVDEIINSGMADVIFRGDSIHIPFNQCNKYLKDSYISTIFKYGLDNLPVPITAWPQQTSKKAVELVLYALNKTEFEQSAKGADGTIKTLLTNDNVLLFDEALTLVSDDERIPVVRVCKEVQRIIEQNKKEARINLADKLRFLTLPEYGYYQNRLFMAAVAFALRPYVDRMYTSGSGQRIDKTVMKDVIVSMFAYWDNSKKFNDKFIVRMSTEEERELTEKLNTVFGISDKDGLLGTKWAIREAFQKKAKAPLWVLKHVGATSKKYNDFIDKLFKFSKSTDENIDQSFIEELLVGIKTFDVELSNALSGINSDDCLDVFICNELAKIGESSESLPEVRKSLAGRMSGDIVFWEEKDVHEQILYWALEKKKAAEDARKAGESRKAEEAYKAKEDKKGNTTKKTERTADNPADDFGEDDDQKELLSRAKEKLLSHKNNSDSLYNLLIRILDSHEELASLIDEML